MVSYAEILKRHTHAMEPMATNVSPRLAKISGIRAVLFDVYGTLLISASGDVGTVAAAPAQAFADACAAVGLTLSIHGEEGAAALVESIQQSHARSRAQGIEYPEVDIVAVWQETIARLAEVDVLNAAAGEIDCEQLAIEYEVRVNPVWPMPGAESCLAKLRAAQIPLGIVSNAQFFTPVTLATLLGQPLEELGFEDDLCVWSFRHAQAKPGTFLFLTAQDCLARRSIAPGEVLYIGNDMLNDILPASQLGFRTALFAGDARSLRLREDDDRVRGLEPDLVITHWDQLFEAIDL